MERPDERDRRIQELEERLSRLSSASLRITEGLDFNTVLQRADGRAVSLREFPIAEALRSGD